MEKTVLIAQCLIKLGQALSELHCKAKMAQEMVVRKLQECQSRKLFNYALKISFFFNTFLSGLLHCWKAYRT